jgi:hypothetical protein
LALAVTIKLTERCEDINFKHLVLKIGFFPNFFPNF